MMGLSAGTAILPCLARHADMAEGSMDDGEDGCFRLINVGSDDQRLYAH